jgi:hypothetical protein
MSVLLACEVSEGLRRQEATVKVIAADGVAEYMPVDRSILCKEGTRYYLPVTLVSVDRKKKAALVGLPVEADSGARRIWVKETTLNGMEQEALT